MIPMVVIPQRKRMDMTQVGTTAALDLNPVDTTVAPNLNPEVTSATPDLTSADTPVTSEVTEETPDLTLETSEASATPHMSTFTLSRFIDAIIAGYKKDTQFSKALKAGVESGIYVVKNEFLYLDQ